MTFLTPCFVAVLLLLSTTSAKSAEIVVDWKIPEGDGAGNMGFYPDMKANVGDTVVFNWQYFHNVFVHPTGNCVETGAIYVGNNTGTSYTFTSDNVGKMVFSCDVGNHCELGQIVTFEVSAADNGAKVTATPTAASAAATTTAPTASPKGKTNADIVVDWIIPIDGVGPLPPKTAKVGETIRFDWVAVHNVYIHPKGGCDETDAVLVGDKNSNSASYKFTKDDVGDVVFACDISSHCELGQIMTVTVSEESETSGSRGNCSMWVLSLLFVVATIFL